MSRYGLRAALLSGGLLLGAGAAEVLVRAADMTFIPAGTPGSSGWLKAVEHPRGRYRYSYDSLGYRTPEWTKVKSTPERRILLLGDSHMEGALVDQDDLASVRLERLLNAQDEDPLFRVRNIAKSGASPVGYLRHFRRNVEYAPDLVVIVIYSGNDLLGHFLDTGDAADPAAPGWISRIKSGLRRFETYHVLAQAAQAMRGERRAQRAICTGESAVVEWVCNGGRGPYPQVVAQSRYFLRHPDRLEPVANDFGAMLDRLATEIRHHDVPTLVAVLPSKIRVDRESWRATGGEVARLLRLDRAAIEQMDAQIHEMVVRAALASFPIVVDLFPSMQERFPDAEKFWTRDYHLNTLGHALVAEAISTAIEEHSLLDRSGSGGSVAGPPQNPGKGVIVRDRAAW